jgi:hypothetical protein
MRGRNGNWLRLDVGVMSEIQKKSVRIYFFPIRNLELKTRTDIKPDIIALRRNQIQERALAETDSYPRRECDMQQDLSFLEHPR